MKRIKRIGLNIDPCRTLILPGLSEDLALLIVICCLLSSRKMAFWKPKNTPPANVPE